MEISTNDIAEILGRKLPEIPLSYIAVCVEECIEVSYPSYKEVCCNMFPTLDEHSQKKLYEGLEIVMDVLYNAPKDVN